MKGAAARRSLRAEFRDRPEAIYQGVEERMRERVTSDARVVLPPEYLEDRALIGPNRNTIAWMWIIGHIHAYLMQGDLEHARALSALALGAGEQLAMDEGNWQLPWLITLLQEPPFSTIQGRKQQGDLLEPHSALLDERWVEAHLAYLADADKITERRAAARNRKFKDKKKKDEEEAEGAKKK